MEHMDPDVRKAMTELADVLCQWERNTGRKSVLIFVPEESDEELALCLSGKPVSTPDVEDVLTAMASMYLRKDQTLFSILTTAAANCPIQR